MRLELRIQYRDIWKCEYNNEDQIKVALKEYLKANGFDLTMPISRYDDIRTHDMVFVQEIQEQQLFVI